MLSLDVRNIISVGGSSVTAYTSLPTNSSVGKDEILIRIPEFPIYIMMSLPYGVFRVEYSRIMLPCSEKTSVPTMNYSRLSSFSMTRIPSTLRVKLSCNYSFTKPSFPMNDA